MQRLHIEFTLSVIARSRHDSDDGHRRHVFVSCLVVIDVLADGISSSKIFLRERLIDDDRARMTFFARQILGPKSATSENWHSHKAEVVGRDYTDLRRRLLAKRNRRRASHVEITVLFGVVERTVRAHGGGLDARNP